MERNIINLNLIMSYPVKWDLFKVFRDFIQNFYDSVSYKDFQERFFYEYDSNEKVLILRCSDVSYSYEWLLHIGASSKTNSKENMAGYFGEGFKIAALCAKRDFGFEIEASSRNWCINVVESEVSIDGNSVKSLAYELELNEEEQSDSVLILRNVKAEHMERFEGALQSFYYIGNPLIGETIYSDYNCAIHKRSDVKKKSHYPDTFSVYGEGIIFAAFQARGSLKEELIFCLHNYKSEDRDRDFFSEMDNINIIIQCIYRITPEVAAKLLIMYKKYWYSYPKEEFGYKSYYTVIKNLIFKLKEDRNEIEKFINKYPNLLYAEQISQSNKRAINDRRYCLAWLKSNKEFTLVQDSFKFIQVESLEEKCRKEDVLPRIDMPSEKQREYINLLEECVKKIFAGFIETESLPECMVIRNLKATVSGYASLFNNSNKKYNAYGYLYKYRVERICIKDIHLKSNTFSQGLSVYIHELCHCFGGDKSEVFSYAMTDAMEILINNSNIVQEYKKLWDEI